MPEEFPACLADYEVLEELGTEGSGTIYRARQRSLDRTVAVHLVRLADFVDSAAVERFLRGAKAAAQLDHPAIVRVYDVGQGEGWAYVATGLVTGPSLAEQTAGKPRTAQQAADLTYKLATAIAAAHKKGILHCGLSPHVVRIDANGQPRITGFGTERLLLPGATLTAADSMISPFTPPELVEGGSPHDPRVDVYGLGSVLYVMLTGQHPFVASSVAELALAIASDAPTAPSQLQSRIPRELERICLSCLAKDVTARPASAEALAASLEKWIAPASRLSRSEKLPDTARVTPDSTRLASGTRPIADHAPRRKKRIIASIGAATLLAAIAGIVWFSRRGDSGPVAAPNDSAAASRTAAEGDSPTPQSTDAKKPTDAETLFAKLDAIDAQLAESLPETGWDFDYGAASSAMDEAFREFGVSPGVASTAAARARIDALPAAAQTRLRYWLVRWELVTTAAKPTEGAAMRTLNSALDDAPWSQQFLVARSSKNASALLQFADSAPTDLGVDRTILIAESLAAQGLLARPESLAFLKKAATLPIDEFWSQMRYAQAIDLKGQQGPNSERRAVRTQLLGALREAIRLRPTNAALERRANQLLAEHLSLARPLPPLAIAPFNAAEARQHQEAWAKHLGMPVEFTNSIGMKFRLVPPGEFLMGAPQAEVDQHVAEQEDRKLIQGSDADRQYWRTLTLAQAPPKRVLLTTPFYLGVHEVTQAQYEQVMLVNPSWFSKSGSKPEVVAEVAGLDTSQLPVEGVTWVNANEFCAKLGEREKYLADPRAQGAASTSPANSGYRLPTEAEWEFACRAGTTTRYWSGDSEESAPLTDWLSEVPTRPYRVGQLAANPFGLHDLLGNVHEWMLDSWQFPYVPATAERIVVDPSNLAPNTHRALRGGDYLFHPALARSAVRLHFDSQNQTVGFRAVLSVESARRAKDSEAVAKQLQADEADRLLQEGRQARAARDFSSAIPRLREAAKLAPEQGNIQAEWTATLLCAGHTEEANQHLRKIADRKTSASARPDSLLLDELWQIFQIAETAADSDRNSTQQRALERAWAWLGKNRWGNEGAAPPLAVAPFDTAQAHQHQLAWARYLGVPVEFTNSLGMRFRLVPPGVFVMGNDAAECEAILVSANQQKLLPEAEFQYWNSCIRSESPRHRVVVPFPFFLGTCEVTQQQYAAVAGSNPSWFAKSGEKPEYVATIKGLDTSNHPVENVSWTDAVNFCHQLSEREQYRSHYQLGDVIGHETLGNGYRLPTDAEWEYACRAGTVTRYWNGETEDECRLAEWCDNSGRSRDAGLLRPNPFGIFDLHGNVMELLEDAWTSRSYTRFNATTNATPESHFSRTALHCFRGSYFHISPLLGRSASHRMLRRTEKNGGIGFRVVLSVEGVRGARESEHVLQQLNAERAVDLLRQARQALASQKHAEALQQIRDAVALWREVPNADAEFAATLLCDGQDERAEPMLRRIAQGSGSDVIAWRKLRESYFAAEKTKQADDLAASRRATERAWAFQGRHRFGLTGAVPPLAQAPFDSAAARSHQEAWAKYLGVPVEFSNTLEMKFQLIPPGEFLMGATGADWQPRKDSYEKRETERKSWATEYLDSERPAHRVLITRPYYIATYETTYAQFAKFAATGGGGNWSRPEAAQDRDPSGNISAEAASRFCVWLSQQEKRTYRLPTEAEWEFAARAGTTTRYFTGDDEASLQGAANVPDQSLQGTVPFEPYYYWYPWNDGFPQYAPVGSFRANPFGLHDVIGNVFEWTSDWYSADYYGKSPTTDPTGAPLDGKRRRVARGASAVPLMAPEWLTSSARIAFPDDGLTADWGCRILLEVETLGSYREKKSPP